MKSTRQKASGWGLIILGGLIATLSQQIVFPGLERLLGIETIVGRDSVFYQPDGTYLFTNPGLMVRWVFSVAAAGVLIAAVGVSMLFRARHLS